MNTLTDWIRTVLIGYRRTLTAHQLAGNACALCGQPFTTPEHREDFGWIGLPRLRRAYACPGACTLTAVSDVQALFRSAIPARRPVWFYHLSADDLPLVTGPDGTESVDEAYAAQLSAQPRVAVEIAHRSATLTTRPLPAQYAEQVASQAQRLGFATAIREEA